MSFCAALNPQIHGAGLQLAPHAQPLRFYLNQWLLGLMKLSNIALSKQYRDNDSYIDSRLWCSFCPYCLIWLPTLTKKDCVKILTSVSRVYLQSSSLFLSTQECNHNPPRTSTVPFNRTECGNMLKYKKFSSVTLRMCSLDIISCFSYSCLCKLHIFI